MDHVRLAAVSTNYFNMPLWVAVHTGQFADEGIEVALELHEPIDEVTQLLKDGEVQFSCGVTEHVILDSEGGGNLEIIGGNVNKLPFSLIAHGSIKSFEDMRGKTVGVSSLEAGSSSLVMKLFSAHGLEYPRDYEMVACGPILTRWEMLRSGEIQAGLQGVPLNYVALDEGYTTLAEPRDQFPDFQFTSLNVDSVWARENKDLTIRFMRGFVKAHEWFFTHREEATDIAVRETGVDRDYALRAWDEYTGAEIFPRDGDASDAAVQTLIDISSLIRALPGRSKTNAGDYINREYLRAARAGLAATV
ncbi:ABC transporter substrate-binding protein [Streptomyces sp. NPDC000880]